MSLIIGIKPYNAIFAHRQFLVSFDVLEPFHITFRFENDDVDI